MSALLLIDQLIKIFNNSNDKKTNNDEQNVQTTIMIATKKQIPPYHVIHDVDWGKNWKFDPTWKFDPSLKHQLKGRNAWVIEVLSPTECTKLIQLTELLGYVSVGYDIKYRSNTRTQTKDSIFNQIMYNRIKQCCPKQIKLSNGEIWQICGLNERFRWCRYIKGQKFETHLDGQFEKNDKQKSFYTVNVYLNDGIKDFKGGRTLFYSTNDWAVLKEHDDSVTAKPGLALIFNQYPSEIHHSGEMLSHGVKYLMRTDVVYKLIKAQHILKETWNFVD